jgi:hypothetical protein
METCYVKSAAKQCFYGFKLTNSPSFDRFCRFGSNHLIFPRAILICSVEIFCRLCTMLYKYYKDCMARFLDMFIGFAFY